MILKMHNKMKSLESKYLDLANFYKRGLLSGPPTNIKFGNNNQRNYMGDGGNFY
jgi:hypothetical protein